MKLCRLYQPRDLRFWLLIALNAVSAAVTWILQFRQIPYGLQLVFGAFAIGNFVLGLVIARRLMRGQ